MPELVNYSQNTLGKNIYGGIGDLAKEINPDYAGSAQEAASELLRDLGVPGLRYLDNITQSGTTGTRNMVVFPGNENLITILERNGEIINPQPIVKALRNGN
jgi:hypothetical protein